MVSNTFLLLSFLLFLNTKFIPQSNAFPDIAITKNSAILSAVPSDMDLEKINENSWRKNAIQKLWDDRKIMSHTPILHFPVPSLPNVDIIFKDESTSKTGSLKHRFAWALFLWGLVEGHIGPSTTLYEASSGNTATSEAYFAQLLNLTFITVLSHTTSPTKLERIKKFGGDYIKTDLGNIFKRARDEAEKNNGFFINQFVNADKAEEYHESGGYNKESTNMFHEVIQQLQTEQKDQFSYPDYFVHTAGTGGTITSVGRYTERYALPTKVVLADTEFSINLLSRKNFLNFWISLTHLVYYDYVVNGLFTNETGEKLWITPGMEGTGFGYAGPVSYGVSTSLQPSVIDRVIKIPDLASTAAMHFLKRKGINGGTSTGVNFVASLSIAAKEKNTTSTTSTRIVTVLCDSDSLYRSTYYNETWIEEKFVKHGGLLVFKCWEFAIEYAYKHGIDPLEYGAKKCKRKNSQR